MSETKYEVTDETGNYKYFTTAEEAYQYFLNIREKFINCSHNKKCYCKDIKVSSFVINKDNKEKTYIKQFTAF